MVGYSEGVVEDEILIVLCGLEGSGEEERVGFEGEERQVKVWGVIVGVGYFKDCQYDYSLLHLIIL